VNCDPAGDPISELGLEVACNTNLLPYVVWPNASGLHVASPYVQEQGFNAANMFADTVAPSLFIGSADPDGDGRVALGAATDAGWQEDGHDALSVRLTWPALKLSAPLVRGSPIIAIESAGAPLLIAAEQQIASLAVRPPPGGRAAQTAGGRGGKAAASGAGKACEAAGCDGESFTASKLVLSLAQSDETWLLYATPPITLVARATVGESAGSVYGGSFRLAAADGYAGVVRLALLSNCTSGASQQHCVAPGVAADPAAVAALESLFDAHAAADGAAYAIGGAVDFKIERSGMGDGGEAAVLRYAWKSRSVDAAATALAAAAKAGVVGAKASAAAGDSDAAAPAAAARARARGGGSGGPAAKPKLLLAMMPHHTMLLPAGPSPMARTGLGYRGVLGFAELVSAAEWELTLPLPAVDFHAARPVPARARKALEAELAAEAAWAPPPNYLTGAGDPYNGGKLLSRMARTALIAQALGDGATAAAVGANLTALVHAYNVAGAQNEWVYDATWGGLVGCGCAFDDCQGKCVGRCTNAWPNCPSLADPGRDFGNGFYNDHHFHWGYHVYAAGEGGSGRGGEGRGGEGTGGEGRGGEGTGDGAFA
jgi:hypothetical protein